MEKYTDIELMALLDDVNKNIYKLQNDAKIISEEISKRIQKFKESKNDTKSN